MLTFTVEELIHFLSNWTMTFFEGAKRSGDIVFSHYYSFFKHPVLVREHQVESLYVMVQDRDSSDGKKSSFSRFAKWEFGGFIVDSKTIYLASKTIKELLQNSDFIDDIVRKPSPKNNSVTFLPEFFFKISIISFTASALHPNLKTLWSSWKTLSFPTTNRSSMWLQAVWKLWGFQSRRVITTRTTSPPLMCQSSLSASITLF